MTNPEKYFSCLISCDRFKNPNILCHQLFVATEDRRLILFMVFIAILLDNMLLTTVGEPTRFDDLSTLISFLISSAVPIVPDYLYQLEHEENTSILHQDNRTEVVSATGFPLEDNITVENASWVSIIQKKPDTDLRIGFLFGSKAAVQLISNPFIVYITNRIGYRLPLFTGLCIMFTSTIVFALCQSYQLLFVARCAQGIGSAFISVSGMGMVAQLYPDDRERGRAMGVALSGLALGVLFGPPFGGLLYTFMGKAMPFLILALLAMLDGLVQMIIAPPRIMQVTHTPTPFLVLLKDKYILITAATITVTNMGVAMLEPSLPSWMEATMNSKALETGVAFLPISITYLIGANIFGHFSHRIGRWLSAMIGMVFVGTSLLVLPFATSIYLLIAPLVGMGIGMGMVDASMMPLMGYLTDIRHTAVYGTVYAIADMAFCLGFAFGPTLSGTIVNFSGFAPMVYTIGAANLVFAPMLFKLRRIPLRKRKNIPKENATIETKLDLDPSSPSVVGAKDVGVRSDAANQSTYRF